VHLGVGFLLREDAFDNFIYPLILGLLLCHSAVFAVLVREIFIFRIYDTNHLSIFDLVFATAMKQISNVMVAFG
jgi:hypothetical protein